MASISTVESDLLYPRTPLGGVLTVVFDVHIHKKYGLLKPEVADLDVYRNSPAKLKDLFDHLRANLPNTNGDTDQLLLKANCARPNGRNSHLQNGYLASPSTSRKSSTSTSSSSKWKRRGLVPLVCKQIWSSILLGYPEPRLRVVVDQYVPEVKLEDNSVSCILPRWPTMNPELKYVDVAHFLPSRGLKADHILRLCRDIFERGVKIKPELRRGVWLHLVGVFHPDLASREERERYIGKLRMAYDHLKGKIMGETADMADRQQLVDAVHRDAIRTDPNNPFFADHRLQEASYISQHYHRSNDEENNIQKLINIVVIYTLEHEHISYTQGMTDILSPILYVMKNEADAYICFAAMVERIKQHFGQWCTGTLHKLDRLRHLCEVLDPQLYQCLKANSEEDPFVLFFGMVLIECRREFAFSSSFHLLETIWSAVACIKNSRPSSSDKTHAEWARYMTYESPEVLQQVFEGSGMPYSAVPLRHTISGSYSTYYTYSRNPSLLSQQSPPTNAFLRRHTGEMEEGIPEATDVSSSPPATPLSINHDNSSFETQQHRTVVAYNDDYRPRERADEVPRLRSQSDSNLRSLSHEGRPPTKSISTGAHVNAHRRSGGESSAHKLGNSSFSHSESELYDSFSNSKIMVQPRLGRNPTEMSDMSSISSGTASGNLISSVRSMDSRTRSNSTGETGAPAPVAGVARRWQRQRRSESTPDGGSGRSRRHTSSGSDSDNATRGGSGGSPSTGGRGNGGVSPSSTGGGSSSSGGRGNGGGSPSSGGHGTGGGSPSSGGTGGGSPDSARRGTPNSDSAESSDFRDAVESQPPQPQPLPSDVAGTQVPDQQTATGMNHTLSDTQRGGTQKVPEHKTTPTGPSEGANQVTTTEEEVDEGMDRESLQDLLDMEVVERGGRITTNTGYRSPLIPRHSPYSASTSSRSTPHPHPSPHPPAPNGVYPASEGDIYQHRKVTSSPRNIHRTPPPRSNASTPVHYGSANNRVTPVAFFDTMEKLAESLPGKGPAFPSHFTSRRRGNAAERKSNEGSALEEEEKDEEETLQDGISRLQVNHNRERADSDPEISLLLSQLVSTEQGAPRVNTEDSLTIPFSDCYSLFVCLSILVQNREAIMETGADFYQLSTILNAQAARQDLDRTLKVSHQLYRIYRQYQEMCFGASGVEEFYDRWLDDTAVV